MRRIVFVLVVGVLLIGGGIALRNLLASDETKIRWLIEDSVEAFNRGWPGSTVEPLAEDWYDRTSGVHRDTLHRMLVGMTFQNKDARTGEFLWECVVPEESLSIEVPSDGEGTARATLTTAFSRKEGSKRTLEWRIAIEAKLREGEDGWEIWSTSHETLEGERPGG